MVLAERRPGRGCRCKVADAVTRDTSARPAPSCDGSASVSRPAETCNTTLDETSRPGELQQAIERAT
jgi:hypothetical protein